MMYVHRQCHYVVSNWLMHDFQHMGGKLQPVVVNLMISALETYHLLMTDKLWLLKRDYFLVSKLLYLCICHCCFVSIILDMVSVVSMISFNVFSTYLVIQNILARFQKLELILIYSPRPHHM